MKPYTLDWTRWPIVLLTPASRAMSNEELRACMDEVYEGLVNRQGQFVIVQDLRHSPGTSPSQRRMQAEEMARVQALTQVNQLGAAFVFSSVLLRGMMSAIFWMYRPRWETRVFAEVDQALAWADQLLQKHKA